MRFLLIGSRSYVGQSLTAVKNQNIDWISISRENLEFLDSSISLQSINAVVVIATPAMHSLNLQWDLDVRVERLLNRLLVPKICISSIRTEDKVNNKNEFYINALNKFEAFASKNNWHVLRISNFLGLPPFNFPNQKRLLPWNLFSDISVNSKVELRSVPSQITEWVDAEDVILAILLILKSELSGKFITRPSFEIKLSNIVDLISDNFKNENLPMKVSYGIENRMRKNTIDDLKLSQIGWKTHLNRDILLEYVSAYQDKFSPRRGHNG